MSINKVTAGDNVPHEFNVIVEIPMNGVTGRRLRIPRPAAELNIHQPLLELAAYSAAKRGLSI
jgi:hypothetical protein